MINQFDRSVADVEQSMLESKLRRVQPGDEVGAMRARKIAKTQAGPMHEALFGAAIAHGWIEPEE